MSHPLPPQAQAPWTPPVPTTGATAWEPRRRTPGLGGSVVVLGAWLALLWVIEVADVVLGGALDSFGVSTRDVADLPQVLTAPFVHFGFEHLLANSLPFVVLGALARTAGRLPFLTTTLASVLASGLCAWLLSAPMTVTGGASGLIFGWLAFLLVRGLFTGNWIQLLVGAAVFGFFGGMLWGVFPTLPGVSWQAHLGGALGGAASAWLLGRGRPAR